MSDMVQKLENESENKEVKFARSPLSWFETNIPTGDGVRTWKPLAWDKQGITILQHHSANDTIQVWHRVSAAKSNSIFEKRLEYPASMDDVGDE